MQYLILCSDYHLKFLFPLSHGRYLCRSTFYCSVHYTYIHFFFFFSYQVRVFTKVYPLSLHELFACIFISFNFYFPSKCPNITTVLVSLKQQIILPNYNHHFLQSTFFFLSVKGMLFFIYNFYICYQDSTSYFRPLLLS